MLTHPENRNWTIEIGRRVFLYSLFSILYSLPRVAEAALTPIVPCGGPGQADCTFKDLGALLVGIYDFLLGFAGLVALMFIIYGGIKMLQGWLSEEPETTFKEGKLTVQRAIGGLVILALAFTILHFILAIFEAPNIDKLFDDVFK